MTEEQAPYLTPPLIYTRIAAISKEIPAIAKLKEHKQGPSGAVLFNFRGIDDVYNAIQPILAKHEVFTITTVLSDRTEERTARTGGALIYRILTVKHTYYTIDGSSVETIVIGEGMDSGDKAANKAMAIAHKYSILQTFCVPTQDMPDPDADSHEVVSNPFITEAQAKEIEALIKEKGVDKAKVLEYAKADKISSIKAADFDKIIKLLQAKKKPVLELATIDQYNQLFQLGIGLESPLNKIEIEALVMWYQKGPKLTKAEADALIADFEGQVNRYIDENLAGGE